MKRRKIAERETGGAELGPETGTGPSGQTSVTSASASEANRKSSAGGRIRKDAPGTDEYVRGILAGDRVMLGRTITLIESRKQSDNATALQVLQHILPRTGRSIRIGITGVPGVGKSTFIECLGQHVIAEGHRLAVLAIDPSSQLSRGSIMGDKTRMEALSRNPHAFIRPSPSSGSLGGVAHKTREAMLVCEAAGFDVVFVETVGVGQSETLVHSMVDIFLLLLLPNAGDQLQGIKRGIMELADAVIIHKADGENVPAAKRAKTEFDSALQLLSYPYPDWRPPVLACSSLTGDGIADVWNTAVRYRDVMTASGILDSKRREQSAAWMHETIQEALHSRFLLHANIKDRLHEFERKVLDGELPALVAARELLDLYDPQRDNEIC